MARAKKSSGGEVTVKRLDEPIIIATADENITIRSYVKYVGDNPEVLNGGLFYLNFYGMCTRFWLRLSKRGGNNRFFLSFPATKSNDGEWVDSLYLEDVADRTNIINAIVNYFFN